MSAVTLPIIINTGDGLALREATLRPDDLACLAAQYGSEDMPSFVDDPAVVTSVGAAQFSHDAVIEARLSARSPAPRVLLLMICEEPTGRSIGSVTLDRDLDRDTEWELGIWVAPEDRRAGVAARVVLATLRWLSAVGATVVWADAVDDRSARLAERCGFQRLARPDHRPAARAGTTLLGYALEQHA